MKNTIFYSSLITLTLIVASSNSFSIEKDDAAKKIQSAYRNHLRKSRPVILLSSDGKRFRISKEAANVSNLLKEMLENDEDNQSTIPLPIKSETLKHIIEYSEGLNFSAETNHTVTPKASEMNDGFLKSLPISWEWRSIRGLGESELYELILAANYLDIPLLRNNLSSAFAESLKDKTSQHLRETLIDTENYSLKKVMTHSGAMSDIISTSDIATLKQLLNMKFGLFGPLTWSHFQCETLANSEITRRPIAPIFENDPRITQEFALIKPRDQAESSMYQFGKLILSDVAEDNMNIEQAIQYCVAHGARLPTAEEWKKIRTALSPNGIYNRDLIPNMTDRWFWSLSVRWDRPDCAFSFYGRTGLIGDNHLNSDGGSVRCVLDAS